MSKITLTFLNALLFTCLAHLNDKKWHRGNNYHAFIMKMQPKLWDKCMQTK